MGCRVARARDWAIRIEHEKQCHNASAFVTLTYDDAHLPADRSVDPRAWQLFAKRLRQQLGPFRFFHIGEYGDEYQRPHYHAAIFGQDFSSDRRLMPTHETDRRKFTSDTLSECWGNGRAELEDLNGPLGRYLAGYITKKLSRDEQQRRHGVDVRPAYATMSRRKGLGETWFTEHGRQVMRDGYVVYNGSPKPIPRYYLKLIEKLDPLRREELADLGREAAARHQADRTRDRRETRELVQRLNSVSIIRDAQLKELPPSTFPPAPTPALDPLHKLSPIRSSNPFTSHPVLSPKPPRHIFPARKAPGSTKPRVLKRGGRGGVRGGAAKPPPLTNKPT